MPEEMRETIKTSRDMAILWTRMSDYGKQYVIGCFQHFRDKSVIVPSAIAKHFFTMHGTLLSFFKERLSPSYRD